MATSVLSPSRPFRGLRPLDPRRDLAQVADLIELAFAGDLDRSGYSALRELRLIGYLGGTGSWLSSVSWSMSGYVWVEEGRVVGNVTVQRADRYGRRWQIANVAVAPEYRRRGIARALMTEALNHIRDHGGTWAILQVRRENVAARRLYEQLGFEDVTAVAELSLAAPPREPFPVTAPWLEELSPEAWMDVFDLARASLPPMAQWWQPLTPERFQITAERRLSEWLSRLLQGRRTWRLGWYEGAHLQAAVEIQHGGFGDDHRLTIWLHPSRWGQWEGSLIAQAMNRLVRAPARRVTTRVNTAHEALIEALTAVGFRNDRTLVTMRCRISDE